MTRLEPATLRRVFHCAWLGGSAFLLLQILIFGYGRDQAIYAVVARSMLAGGMPYRDAWDFKPPGIFLIYALARGLFGSSQMGIRILEVLGLAVMIVAMVRLTERWWGEPTIGVIAGGLAVLNHAQYDFWHTAQPESFGGILAILALLVLGPEDVATAPSHASTSRSPARGWLRWLASGALFGFCGLLKPPLAGGGAVVAAAVIWQRLARREGWSKGLLQPFLAFFVGGCLPLVAALAWFWWRGALADLVETLFIFAPRYTALAWQGAHLQGMLWRGLSEWFLSASGASILGLLLLLGLPPRGSARRGVWLLVGLAAVQFSGVLMQGKFFTYHYGAAGPIVALLAGLGLFQAWQRLTRFRELGLAAFFLVVGAAALLPWANRHYDESFWSRCCQRTRLLASGLSDVRLADQLTTAFGVDASANRAVAGYLAAHVSPDRPVLVWGFEPVVYDLAGREAATRYIYNVPQRSAWSRAEAQERMMRDLCARPPAAIVVEHEDRMSWVTGAEEDSAEALAEFPRLAGWLSSGYRLAQSLQGFDVYLEEPSRREGFVVPPAQEAASCHH